MHRVYRWYRNGIPKKRTVEFTRFLGNAHQLSKQFSKSIESFDNVRARFPWTDTKKSYIPNWIGSLEDEALLTAFWNDAVLRNAAVVNYSLRKTHAEDFHDSLILNNEQRIIYSNFSDNLFASHRVYHSSFGLFEDVVLDYMYNVNTWNQAYQNEDYYMLLEHWFSPRFRSLVEEIFGQEVCLTLDKISREKLIGERLILTKHLQDLLEQFEEDQNNQSQEKEEEQPEQQQESSGEQDSEENEEQEESIQEETFNDFIEQNVYREDFIKEVTYDLNTQIQKEEWLELWSLEAPDPRQIKVLDALNLKRKRELKHSSLYDGFGRYLKYVATPIYNPSIPHWTGDDVLEDELHNILIDGSVLGVRQRRVDFQPAHVIILCDISGSTRGTLMEKELQAAKSAFKDLRNVGHYVEVWAHTTGSPNDYSRRDDYTLLFKICDNRSVNIDELFDRIMALGNNSNHDYDVIKYLISHMKKNRRYSRKFLWVLADGQPIGENPIEKTRKIAEYGRNQGITITSVSLISDVIHKNNRIYGEKNNIDASTNIDQAIKQLALSISRLDERHKPA